MGDTHSPPWRIHDWNVGERWDLTRSSILGGDESIETWMGRRRITYADHTASGRCVSFIEDYLREMTKLYGNTHTSDTATGRITEERLRRAEETIKRHFDADERYVVIAAGNGTSGAIHRLQQILGVFVSPALRARFENLLQSLTPALRSRLTDRLADHRPVVFLGPYEHNSNVLSWREGFADVVEIELDKYDDIDLRDLERKLSREEYAGRPKIGSFSAASNVTGIRSRVYDIAALLHRHGAYAFFDCAALAPHAPVPVMRDDDNFLDGIFYSPHKFLGGPGSAGILIIHRRVYNKELPPTCPAGGTVEFVTPTDQVYEQDIELREKPGTPGILQTLKAALVLELKEWLGSAEIAQRESELLTRVFDAFETCPAIDIVGHGDATGRIGIVSFNIRDGKAFLHAGFVAVLLNDLFGIQARAGCLCAGTFGHRYFKLGEDISLRYRELIRQGLRGLLPGWTRVTLHFLMTDDELRFLCNAVLFVARYGKSFLPLYRFDPRRGDWRFGGVREEDATFGLSEAIEGFGAVRASAEAVPAPYDLYLREARHKARELERDRRGDRFRVMCEDLVPFWCWDHPT
jgi:selenocysteine lyase/cysteine desulfurase